MKSGQFMSPKNEDSEAIFNAFTQTINSHNLTESERLKLLNLLLTSDTLSQEEFLRQFQNLCCMDLKIHQN